MSVERFLEYLAIKSVHPNPDYEGCVQWLSQQAKEIGLEMKVYYCVPKKPIVILSVPGVQRPDLPALMLNSHMDVVPVDPEKWILANGKPFDPIITKDGKIVGRGSQDMKCVGLMYLEALRNLIFKEKFIFTRKIHVVFVPDEEIGGNDGMNRFVSTPAFQSLNVGFALDEGLANPNPCLSVFMGERAACWIEITCEGRAGHGSQLFDRGSTVGEKISHILTCIEEFRKHQVIKIEAGANIGDISSINVTGIECGHVEQGKRQVNVIPTIGKIYLDFRVGLDVSFTRFIDLLQGSWTRGFSGVTWRIVNKLEEPGLTFVSDVNFTQINDNGDDANAWWKNALLPAIEQWTTERNLKYSKEMFRGATDARFVRSKGIPCIGVTPIVNTPILLHDHDEFIWKDSLMEGIKFYELAIRNLASNLW